MRRIGRRAILAALVLFAAAARAEQAQPTTTTQQSGLAGTVTSGGKPVAGAVVRAFHPGESAPAASAATAADGRYRLAPLAQGVYRVEFAGAGYTPQSRAGIVVLDGVMAELNAILTRSSDTASAIAPSLDSPLKDGEVGVRIETTLGFIFLAIDTAHAPITSANFLKYVDSGFYDGGRFHRATRPDNYTPAPPNRPMMEIIQGGIDPARQKNGFPPIPLERTSVTGLKHVRGTVSMARGTAADTATSDFFILLDDQPSLDFGGKRFDDGQGGAAFGRVIAGMDVVRRIQQQPVQGQNLTPPIPIVAARRY